VQRVLIKDFEFNGAKFERLPLVIDKNSNLLLLPLLWSVHLYTFGTSHQIKSKSHGKSIEHFIEESDIHDITIESYFSKVFSFLKSLPDCTDNEIANITAEAVNSYLNGTLPNKGISLSTLFTNLSALSSFFNFLHTLGICPIMRLKIYRKSKQKVEENFLLPPKAKYITKSIRSKLLQSCSNKRDRLILRLGFEVGLRAAENLGLVLKDIKVKNQTISGLLTLFAQLDNFPDKLTFEYYLRGKYAKFGKGRLIYFSRPLLEDLRHYYQTERNDFGTPSTDHLFVRVDNSHQGVPISKEHPTRIFRKISNSTFANLKGSYSYHDLRHTFATELYHVELLDESGLETRSESAALHTVASRLGHSLTKTSIIYVRLLHQMKLSESSPV
jgi:integrase